MEQMTEYERKRLENVQRNQKMLAALGVQGTAQDLRSASKKPKSEPKSNKPPKREREPEPSVLRRSARIRRPPPRLIGDLSSDSPLAKPRKGFIAPSSRTREPQKASKEMPLSLAETYVPHGEEGPNGHSLNWIREPSECTPLGDSICAKPDWGSEGGGHVGPKSSPEDLKLEVKGIAEVAPTRISQSTYRFPQSASATAMEQMAEYERKKLENVQRNQKMLAALGVQGTAQDLRSASKKPKSEPKSNKPPKREREPEPSVLRMSARIRRLPPQSFGDLSSDSPPAKPRKGFFAPSSRTREPQKASKERPLSLAEAYVPYGEEGPNGHSLNWIRELSECTPLGDSICAKPDWGSEGGGHVGPESSPEDLKLEVKGIAEVAPTRIFSVHILPCRERVIVVSGDKKGHLSLWDADCEEGNRLHMYRPHAAPISGIVTKPSSVEKVLSCSIDGFIRCMDFEKEVFHVIYNKTNVMLSAICFAPYNYQSVYFADEVGKMKVLDLRVGDVSNSYNLHKRMINSIDFHPWNPHLVSTSSSDCTASIWDVRKMGKTETESIATVRHERAVLSAYFSPSGNHLATTSYDDTVVLLNGLDSRNTTTIYHHNLPWICSFRAIWGWDDGYLFMGNMEKALDVICTSTKITSTLRSPFLTAIPSILVKHPLQYGILAGATTHGEVYVWRKH